MNTGKRVVRWLQSGGPMAGTCSFLGNYYNPEPWANTPCAVDASVPEGCPIRLVTGARVDTSNVTTLRVASDGTDNFLANTTTIAGTDLRTFQLPDQLSCDCSVIGVAISFERVEVAVPAAVAGDTIHVWGIGYDSQVTITPAAPCAAPDWPTDYEVSLACDWCTTDPVTETGDPSDPDGEPSGCAVGGEASFALAACVLLFVVRRGRL